MTEDILLHSAHYLLYIGSHYKYNIYNLHYNYIICILYTIHYTLYAALPLASPTQILKAVMIVEVITLLSTKSKRNITC